MLETFTELAKQSLFFARYEAGTTGSPAIEVEHLVLGLLRADLPLFWKVFPSRNDISQVRERIWGKIPKNTQVTTSVDLPLSVGCQHVMSYSAAETERLGVKNTGTVHLLLGILQENMSAAAGVLRECGLTVERLDETAQGKMPEAAAVPLVGLRNLVHEAGQGKLPALIGRERELEQVIQILSRRTKSNAVLVGEPGGGEGIAGVWAGTADCG